MAPKVADNSSPVLAGAGSPPSQWVAGLTADMPLLDALEAIFRQRWQGALYYLPLTADKPADVGHVHKLRVASRRLSAVLDAFAEGFPEAPRNRLLSVAQKIRRSCGKARDLDVRRKFLESLVSHASVEDAAVIELLCERAEKRRKGTQKKLQRRLPKLEKRLRRRGADLFEAFDQIRGGHPAAYTSLGQTGVQTLLKEMSDLWTRAEIDLSSGESLHQLRIACKHLRYTCEVFVPILPESFRDDFYPQLEHLQSLLGDTHDATQAARDLKQQRKKWKRTRHTAEWSHSGLAGFAWAELRAGLDTVLLAYAQQADQASTEFRDVWPGFAGDSFRIPVEEALRRLAEEFAGSHAKAVGADGRSNGAGRGSAEPQAEGAEKYVAGAHAAAPGGDA